MRHQENFICITVVIQTSAHANLLCNSGNSAQQSSKIWGIVPRIFQEFDVGPGSSVVNHVEAQFPKMFLFNKEEVPVVESDVLMNSHASQSSKVSVKRFYRVRALILVSVNLYCVTIIIVVIHVSKF